MKSQPIKLNLNTFMELAILFAISFVYNYIFINKGINPLDGGYVAYLSERVAQGHIPYKDFFLLLLPGHFIFNALLFKIFGIKLSILNLSGVVTSALLCTITYWVTRKITTRKIAFNVWLIALVFGMAMTGPNSSYSWNAMLLAIFSIAILIKYFDNFGRWWLFFAGIAAGLSFIFKQTIGIYLISGYILFFVVYFIALRRISKASNEKYCMKDFLSALAGYLLPIAFLTFYLAKNYILKEAVYYSFFYPIKNLGLMRYPVPSIVSVLDISKENLTLVDIQGIIFYLSVTVLLLGWIFILALVIKKLELPVNKVRTLVLLTSVGSTLFLHNFERYSFFKLRSTLPLTLVLGAILTFTLLKVINKNKLNKAITTSLLLILSVSSIIGVHLTIKRFDQPYVSLNIRGSALGVLPDQKNKYAKINEFIRRNTKTNEPIFVVPLDPLIYFLTNRDNPTPYDLIIPGHFVEKDIDIIIQTLETQKIRYIVYDEFWYYDNRMFKDYGKKLWNYIGTYYKIVEPINDRTWILERK